MPNDRSAEHLLQRKRIAEESGKAHPGEWVTDIRWNLKMAAVCDGNGEPLCMMTNEEDVATVAHIAFSDPDTTQQDIDEIIRLRAENERLRGEVESLNKQADWLMKILSLYTEDCPLKFSWVYEEKIPIPKIDGCDGSWPDDDYFDCSNSTPEKCWREAARKAVEENVPARKNGIDLKDKNTFILLSCGVPLKTEEERNG